MQTFLPYADFVRSARALDDRRLGKQRSEALTILRIVDGRTTKQGWRRHPAVLMWQGCAEALKLYLNACLDEWAARGFKNSIPREKVDQRKLKWPWWLGREELHGSHRANLLRKAPEFYGKRGWSEDPQTPYWWPGDHAGPPLDQPADKA
ncbi:MAG: hypothetical protein K9K66_17140 [Desulfarculaceae bacterium]|nr:hypothetical protein [Desulfarculaceae bacterium]MCF8074318.1 hypothetical protein [Desulfarculaceae bacterium]MCF8103386.1 hypothetical protein [Desulfarculaceae bacterium]MCF8117759.1 hypothetical protein [Desulfarculaceae bacterium]